MDGYESNDDTARMSADNVSAYIKYKGTEQKPSREFI